MLLLHSTFWQLRMPYSLRVVASTGPVWPPSGGEWFVIAPVECANEKGQLGTELVSSVKVRLAAANTATDPVLPPPPWPPPSWQRQTVRCSAFARLHQWHLLLVRFHACNLQVATATTNATAAVAESEVAPHPSHPKVAPFVPFQPNPIRTLHQPFAEHPSNEQNHIRARLLHFSFCCRCVCYSSHPLQYLRISVLKLPALSPPDRPDPADRLVFILEEEPTIQPASLTPGCTHHPWTCHPSSLQAFFSLQVPTQPSLGSPRCSVARSVITSPSIASRPHRTRLAAVPIKEACPNPNQTCYNRKAQAPQPLPSSSTTPAITALAALTHHGRSDERER